MIGVAWPLASKTRRMRLDRILLKSKNQKHNKNNKDKKEKEKEKETGKEKQQQWIPKSMRVFGHRPVASPIEEEDEDVMKFENEREKKEKERESEQAGWWGASWDVFGWFTERKVEDYLWPSDHFGLLTVLAPKEESSSSEK